MVQRWENIGNKDGKVLTLSGEVPRESSGRRSLQITATLGGTSQWISEQQKIYGAVEDLLAEPPSLSAGVPNKLSQ